MARAGWARWLLIGVLAVAGCGQGPASSAHHAALGSCPASPGPALLPNALCLCGDLRDVGSLTVGLGSGGGVGVDGQSLVRQSVVVRGSWWNGGPIDLTGSASLEGELRTAGALAVTGDLEVGADLSVGGDLSGTGSARVDGALRLAGQNRMSGLSAQGSADYTPQAAPCPCGETQLFDVAGAVAMARTNNDNAARELPTDSLANAGATLATGRYYFASAQGLGAKPLRIEGAVALFLDGDVDAIGSSALSLAPGATLDLYVAGSVRTVGAVQLGAPQAPSAFRLYIGGTEQVAVGSQIFEGAIYAPRATVSYTGSTIVRGGLFAHALKGDGAIQIESAAPEAPGPSVCEPPPAQGSDVTPDLPAVTDTPPIM